MRERTCCFTGHRHIPANEREQIITELERSVIKLYQQGIIYYGAGGALGFDTIAADTIIRLRKTYPMLKLILVLPCESQTEKWNNPKDIEHYEKIKDQADKIRYASQMSLESIRLAALLNNELGGTSQEYTSGCMYKRNRHLVNNSSVCICYHTKPRGGTAYTVNFAHEKGLQVINLADLLK